MLQQATVPQAPQLILHCLVADLHHDRGADGKVDQRQAQVVVLDLALLRDGPLLVAARVVALVDRWRMREIEKFVGVSLNG